MKAGIVGTGGIGGYFGGLLADRYSQNPDHSIIFISRGTNLEKIREYGLKILAPDKERIVNPDHVVEDPSSLGYLDLVIFAVKSYDLEQAAEKVYSCIGKNTTVITLLNGVNNADILSGLLPKCRLCNGCVYISSRIESPGVIRHVGGPGKIFFGPVQEKTADFKPVEVFLQDAGINVELTEDIDVEVWKKYMFMSPFAGVTALKGQTFGEVLDDPESREMLESMMKELEKLARKKGVALPADIVSSSLETGSRFPSATKSSLQLDFEAGKRSEIQTFAGYVVEEGRRLEIDVPVYELVYSRLAARE